MNANAARITQRNTQRDWRSTHRFVRERIVVTGTLMLETPASFGNGDADAFTDMPLLEDEVDGSPLLTGTSIAGALRNYLREYERGFEGQYGEWEKMLFGCYSGDELGWQSPLIVHDARGQASEYELRDGVKIDLRTRTAANDFKYDYRLLAAGTTFELRFELLVGRPQDEAETDYRQNLMNAFAAALDGLANGAITLGARKRRGLGRCSVKQWEVRCYDLSDHAHLLAWLTEGRGKATDPWATPVTPTQSDSILAALQGDTQTINTKRKQQQVTLTATFGLNGSVMMRSGFGEADQGADTVHLHSFRPESGNAKNTLPRRPVVAGTSWAGALRSRATQIVNTLAPAAQNQHGRALIEGIFGPEKIEGRKKQQARASRLVVNESVITDGQPLQQSRVKIDRFTGGAFESALFEEVPLFGLPQTRVQLELLLRVPGTANDEIAADEQRKRKAEIGLLLLLLKDLWTGDLALGGEVSVGRGRLIGHKAALKSNDQEWLLLERTADGGLSIMGDQEQLQSFVNALKEELHNA